MTAAITYLRSLAVRKNNVEHTRRLFWAWIAYQTIKGTITTSLIWVPLIYAFWGQ